MSLRTEQSAFALDLVRLLVWATKQGYEYTIGEVQRTTDQQKIYVDTGRSRTMNSQHIKKLAADIFFFKEGRLLNTVDELKPIGTAWEVLDKANQWGGSWKSFKDTPHFERKV